ncbi:hypothetical protein TTHERM_01055730 (macronuclear) [Tetrahymena thermophila SB210]|uniref:Uncharacterized protein n=1 Tax=Tetrahymena thermophila (strain SB210) TaxID=312017 RepID=Q24HL4_TETTS|nr:hypothetical protein TTHERM_01055730 [Tetrahymena thermophila SB210]EAS07297.1 hypothetical protein TTHERM_01055730 [Tetrahymena thermophila SB210]|eukprot:XP_001027539.1 hypothetical protein TTHERM_01055730 [Tetrahymena thermophila SB210]
MLKKFHLIKQNFGQFWLTQNTKKYFCSFDSANVPLQVDYNQIMVKIGKAKTFEDKYNILQMKSAQQIFDLVYKPKIQLSLNEYIKILEQLTNICVGQTYKEIYGVEKILSKIEENFKLFSNFGAQEDENSPYIGSLMKSLNQIEYYKNMEFWMKICDQICQERMDFTSKEIRESLLGLFIIKRLSSKEWQQKIVQKSIRILISYFEVHLSKNQFNLDDIVTLGYAFYQHYGQDYLKNKTYILQTIEMNASTQIKQMQDEIFFSNANETNNSKRHKNNTADQQCSDQQSSEKCDQINQEQQQNLKRDHEEKINELEEDIKNQLIQIAFLFSLCDYKSSYIINQISQYFTPNILSQQKQSQYFEKNRYLMSKFLYYLTYIQQKNYFNNINQYFPMIEENLVSYSSKLKQKQALQQFSSSNSDLTNKTSSDYKIVYKRNLEYDDIKQEQFIFQKFNNKIDITLQDLCLILESIQVLNIESIDLWLSEIDFIFSQIDAEACYLMDLVRFLKVRLDIKQIDFNDTPPLLLEEVQKKIMNCRFTQNDVIQFIQFCEENKVTHNFVDLYNYLPYYVANNIFFYTWEEMCFLYYHFIKDRILFQESQISEINGRLNVIKQYIKLEYFSYNNRKNTQMSPESNFYKVLSVVDLNDFYSENSQY